MFKPMLLLASVLLVGGVAHAQAPAAEVKALTARLNQLLVDPKSDDDDTEVRVSLADCGFRQTIRKYRKPDKTSSANIAVSNSKNGSSWGFRSNENVELELTLAQEWAEVGTVTYAARQHDKGGRYFELTVKRREAPKGKSSSGGMAATITLGLNTDNEKEVADLAKRLDEVRRQCTSRKG